jgi:hypothetical protein
MSMAAAAPAKEKSKVEPVMARPNKKTRNEVRLSALS